MQQGEYIRHSKTLQRSRRTDSDHIMLKIEGLCQTYGKQILFDDLSFQVGKGERIGLVGRNGYGKTTLFRMIQGEIEPGGGTITIPKQYSIGYLEQHIDFTENTVLEEGCLGLAPEEKYDTWKAEKVLFGLGFTADDMERDPGEFSGGYRIRLNLAKVLVSRPDLLLLDEPNNYLDIVAIRWLEKFLNSWRGELMLVTHDRTFMDSVTTHTVIIHRHRAKKIKGGTDKIYKQIAVEEDVYEKTRIHEENKRKKQEIFISRFRAKARLAGLVQSRIKALEKQERREKLEKIADLDFSFTSLPFNGDRMLTAQNISFSYTEKGPPLIHSFSLDIGKRERICLVGRNGKGKTTLLKLLAGELSPLAGRIRNHPALKAGYFGQTHAADLNENLNVFEEIRSASPDCDIEKARSIAGMLMFHDEASLKKISVLSGGEKNRILLGKLLVKPCHLLLMDEPTNHLDMQSCDGLLEAIDEFEGSVVMVTHNEMFLNRLAERLVVFDDDRILNYRGPYSTFLENVGWKNEKDEERDEHGSAEEPDRKALKKVRADIINEKSRALRPLKQKLDSLEKTMTERDAELQDNNRKLIHASAQGHSDAIHEYSKKVHDLTQKINDSFEKFEKLTLEYEEREAEFDRKLADARNVYE